MNIIRLYKLISSLLPEKKHHATPAKGIRAVCFDMFFTLGNCHIVPDNGEAIALGIPQAEWQAASWSPRIAHERGLGLIKTDREIIDRVCAALPYSFTEEQKEAARAAREERMRTIVVNIDPVIVETLKALKARGLKLGLISNADASDWIHWHESPLAPLFDDVIFSCNVGMVKPDKAIYDLSLKNLGVKPQEALFVGDGGSDEHFGARRAGMHTVCTEYILQYSGRQRKWIYRNAEYVIRDFRDLLKVIES